MYAIRSYYKALIDLLLETVRQAAAGNLTGEITLEGDEPIDQLAAGIRQMMGDLRHVIGKVIGGANHFSHASTEIAGQSNSVITSYSIHYTKLYEATG